MALLTKPPGSECLHTSRQSNDERNSQVIGKAAYASGRQGRILKEDVKMDKIVGWTMEKMGGVQKKYS